MKSCTGTHNPRSGESLTVTEYETSADADKYNVTGTIHGKTVAGVITLFLCDGEIDGTDWTGTLLTGDEWETVLDLFATDY